MATAPRPSRILQPALKPAPVCIEPLSAVSDSVLAFGCVGGQLDSIRPLSTNAAGDVVVEGTVAVTNCVEVRGEVELAGAKIDALLAHMQAQSSKLDGLLGCLSGLPSILSLMVQQQRELQEYLSAAATKS